MITRNRRSCAGWGLIGLAAAGGMLCLAANPLYPPQPSASEPEKAAVSTVVTAAPAEEWADVPAQTEPEPPSPAPVLEERLFQGWDTASLDAFCAQQSGGFSVYAQDIESGAIYTYNEAAEYYPASTLKAAYALWLCRQGEQGYVDMDGSVDNQFEYGALAGSGLSDYDGCDVIPVWDVMYAMISASDNKAAEILTAAWPGTEETGFCDFLYELGFHAPYSCSMTFEEGIQGIMDVQDAGLLMKALYAYFDAGTETALNLKNCFLDAGHTALYIPESTAAAKKYGSWDYAFHDLAIVYTEHPYILCCMTDQGDQDVDFPAQTVAAMQELGRLVYAQESA